MRYFNTIVVALCVVKSSLGCTTIAVSAGASATNVPMTGHSADCINCDTRLALVPGKTHKEGALHDVMGTQPDFRRRHSDRATVYMNMPDRYPVLVRIPEVNNTYGVWEATYGLINEVGLVMGESSCSSKITASGIDQPDNATGVNGEAVFCIRELIQLGLERCSTAVCAIDLMGAMAEARGFYGESFMGGEALTIADTTGDAWVFHIIQSYTTNTSAIWAAQRVPEGHVAAIGNEFIIKDLPKEHHPDYRYSANIFDEAIAAGFWNGQDVFSFVEVYGTAPLPTCASVRMWNIFHIVAPSLELKYKESPFDLPFSVPVDEKLTKEDVMNLFRSSYKNTEFDMSKGVLAGPFGNINRIEGGNATKKGAFARGISIPRTAYTHIGYPDPMNPAAFFATDTPASSVFVPLLSKTLKEARGVGIMETAAMYASSLQVGRKDVFTKDSAWWAFDIVANWMNINYRNMSQEYVYPMVEKWQEEMSVAYSQGTTDAAKDAQERVVDAWWELLNILIVRYNDGGFNFGPYSSKDFVAIGYPDKYLDDINFDKSFYKDISIQDIVQRAVNASCGPALSFSLLDGTSSLFYMVVGIVVGICISNLKVFKPKSQDPKFHSLLSEP